jgi:tetratricopeptide (TPR) repeat protein
MAFAVGDRARFDELRLTATEDRVDAELALGRHRELVPELDTLAAAHPVREGLWARLAVALYRADRQADALERVRQLRQHLAGELGLEPSSDLRMLEHRLLTHAPELDHGRWDRGEDGGGGSAPGAHNRTAGSGRAGSTTAQAATPGSGAPHGTGGPPPLPFLVERHRAPALVGRSEALDRLLSLVGPGLRRSPGQGAAREAVAPLQIAVITGEPGIGKTTLTAEVARLAHDAGAVVLLGHCDPEPLLPGQPMVEIVDQVVEATEHGLITTLGPHGGELGRLLPGIDRRLPGLAPPGDAPGDTARYLLARALCDALRAAAGGRFLLVVVEDLHWADAMTIDLLRHVVAGGDLPTMTLVVTRRPGPDSHLDALLATLSREAPVTEVALAGLAEDETSALVSAELARQSMGPTSPWLGRSIHTHTGGNPFFTLELARHLAERGTTDLLPTDELPLGVVAVVERRVAELGLGAGAVLRAAAVVGREFDIDLVLDACADSEAAAGLQAASSAGLVQQVPGISGRYSFAHSIVRSVVRRSIGAGDLEALHARIAASIGERRQSPVPHASLAHHWAHAGLGHLDDAVAHSQLAAETSLRDHAYERASKQCDLGLEVLNAAGVQDQRRLRLLLTSADALESGGDRQQAREQAADAFALAVRLGDVDAIAQAATTAVPVLADAATAEILDHALALVPPTHPRRALLLATLASMLGETAVERSDQLIAEARELATRRRDVEALHHVLAYDTFVGHDIAPAMRVAAATEILALAESQWSGLTLDAHTFRGTAHLELGDLRAAERDFAAHERIAAELRAPGPLAVDDQRRAMRALLAGCFDEAEGHVHQAMLHVGDDPAWVSVYGAQLVAIRMERGRHGEALALVDALGPPDADRPLTHATRALMLASVGRPDEAAPLVQDLARSSPGWRRDILWLVTTSILADAAVALGDKDAAAVTYRMLAPLPDRLVIFTLGAVCWGSVERFLAPLAALLGQVDDAVAHHERAIAVHERLPAPTFLVRDRLGLAAVLRQRGRSGDEARAQDLSREARASARALDLHHLLGDDRRAPAAG